MNKFNIKFKGLKEGKYNYRFKLDDDFFERYEESEINEGSVDFIVEMVINRDIIVLNISLKGYVSVQCDRCLDYFKKKIEYKTKLFIESGYENSDISDVDNKIVLSNKEEEIALDKHFYDYIHLSLPYQKFHPEDKFGNVGCNAEMIKKLEDLSSVNTEKKTDPRWDKLKDILN